MRFDFTKLTLGVDELLPSITNEHHRTILLNYRRHSILEVCGYYEQIFEPDMTVEEPRYLIYGGAMEQGSMELIGPQVKALYKGLVDTQSTVMMVTDEKIAVADWGFASEYVMHTFKPGRYVRNAVGEVDDPDAVYLETRTQAMIFPYDERGRMIGEHVWTAPMGTVKKCAPNEIWSVEDVRRVLMPRINAPALRKAA